MPIALITVPGPIEPAKIVEAGRALAEAVARGLHCRVQDVWTYWQPVEVAMIGAERQTPENRVAVIRILGRKRPGTEVRRALAEAAGALSATLALPLEDVWVHWHELPDGTVFAGGQNL